MLRERRDGQSKKAISQHVSGQDSFHHVRDGRRDRHRRRSVIAQMAKEKGGLVVGVLHLPFSIEKSRLAEGQRPAREVKRAADTVVAHRQQPLGFIRRQPAD